MGLPNLHTDIQAEIKPHLANEDQGKNERRTDRQAAGKRKQQRTRNIRNLLSLSHCAGGWWADGIWKTGVPDLPPFFSPSKFSHSPSIVVLPPAGGGDGGHAQTVIISPLEICRGLPAFQCTLIAVIAYIFEMYRYPEPIMKGRFT